VETYTVGPAIEAEVLFQAMTRAPGTTSILSRLAVLQPTLALVHGSSFSGDGAGALPELAVELDARFPASVQPSSDPPAGVIAHPYHATVLVTGEGGMGKPPFIPEAVADTRGRGVLTLHAQPVRSARPLQDPREAGHRGWPVRPHDVQEPAPPPMR
jgi:hypothetical protein